MKQLSKILVPTNFSEHSRRALLYGCDLAAEVKAELVVLHVASELNAWEFYSEDGLCAGFNSGRPWPLDRILSEATLDLNHFLEPQLKNLKQLSCVTKKVVLGPIASQIIWVAEEEKADLVVMSPRRSRGLRHWMGGGITDRVTRRSPCPVLSVTPPLPSRPWRKKPIPQVFGWPRQSAASF
jgi:nucleotide-binding universal stress UspA family protein